MKLFFFLILLLRVSFSFSEEKMCTIYSDSLTFNQKKAFSHCRWRPLFEFYLLEKGFLRELEEGIHCAVEREKKVARPDMLNCDINSSGIPKQAIFTKLFLRCEDIGPSPEYIVYRTWFEEKDIFEACQSV